MRTGSVPWARPDSGFTLLFEAMVMTLVSAMPVKAVARMVGEHDTRLWRVIHHYVDQARAKADASGVDRVAIDETAARRGHDCLTLFVDLERTRVLFATKDAATVAAFADDLSIHGGDPGAVAEVRIDMSPAFIKGVGKNLPNAAVTFDKFHAVQIGNEAVDQVRRDEQKSRPELKNTRYVGLKNESNLTSGQRRLRDSLADRNLKTARARTIRLAFQDFYQMASREAAEALLKQWYFWATHSRLPPVIEAARTIKRHWPPLAGHPAPVRQQDRQRSDRRHQQPRAGRQGQGTRLPLNPQSQSHHLPPGRKARPWAARIDPLLATPNSAEPRNSSPASPRSLTPGKTTPATTCTNCC